ncbi:hypothetical protein VTI74DRAFT_3504 [Chaetomium olivicolor]
MPPLLAASRDRIYFSIRGRAPLIRYSSTHDWRHQPLPPALHDCARPSCRRCSNKPSERIQLDTVSAAINPSRLSRTPSRFASSITSDPTKSYTAPASTSTPKSLATSTEPPATISRKSQRQPSRNSTMSGDRSKASIPFGKGTIEYGYYEKLQDLVSKRKPEDKPRILVFTDIEQDYDDLLAVIFLAEMHRMGAVELAGFVANHHPAEKRAKFLRTVLRLLGLPLVPVAIGSVGTTDLNKHAPDLFYGLKNTTFEKQPWNAENVPLLTGPELLADLTNPRSPITVLLISSLQDISDFFNRQKAKGNSKAFFRQRFKKFVSQGGYKVEKTNDGKTVLAPLQTMQNNKFNIAAAENYTNCLTEFNLPSDAWSREAAKAARLPATFMQSLFEYGLIGAHLKWLWMRQEFKFFWDPCNWPFLPDLDVHWYLETRLGLQKGSEEYKRLGHHSTPFSAVMPFIKVIAYDCCAAVGAVGDDFMKEMSVLGELPGYNLEAHKHRVFGKSPDDLGGVNPGNLAVVMMTFLLGGLKAAEESARAAAERDPELRALLDLPAEKIEYSRPKCVVSPGVFRSKVMPLMKELVTPKSTKDAEKVREMQAELEKLLGTKWLKTPDRDDFKLFFPYEEMYQEVMAGRSTAQGSDPGRPKL